MTVDVRRILDFALAAALYTVLYSSAVPVHVFSPDVDPTER
jgi:hypothetical protein